MRSNGKVSCTCTGRHRPAARRPGGPATPAELGHRTGSSERTLSRPFGSELSMSFHQWRTLLRVQRALLELGRGTSVTDTAIRLGWANPSSFIEAFTDLVGRTPGRYRAVGSGRFRYQGG
jgi:AraC-like DNA-binding protein